MLRAGCSSSRCWTKSKYCWTKSAKILKFLCRFVNSAHVDQFCMCRILTFLLTPTHKCGVVVFQSHLSVSVQLLKGLTQEVHFFVSRYIFRTLSHVRMSGSRVLSVWQVCLWLKGSQSLVWRFDLCNYSSCCYQPSKTTNSWYNFIQFILSTENGIEITTTA